MRDLSCFRGRANRGSMASEVAGNIGVANEIEYIPELMWRNPWRLVVVV